MEAEAGRTQGVDGTVRIWRTTGAGEPIVYLGYQASVESVAFAPHGHRLLTTHDDGTVRIQQCEVCSTLDDVLALAANRTTRELTPAGRKAFSVP
ncbi:MAG TPA: hypothetical protein VGX25_25970 [Actinophytocola sp.]|uniref:WD40 repeat domain-containing protein n=1 Tax=Actinophytocola sp. TaxID=1872138 RepID=UPI002DDCC68E|nr:hypothetical protein [Actinophytocola sp.]HEV2782853.1 hypothetical protein [Actinophytocola sp.]